MERVLQVMVWFCEHGHHNNEHGLFDLMDLEERRHPRQYPRGDREDIEEAVVSVIFSSISHMLFTL